MKEDWTYKKLEEVCSLITKGTTPTSLGFDFTEQGVAFVKIESLTEDGGILPSMVAHISDDCNNALKRSQLEELDILYSIAGALGRVAIVPKSILPANTNQALAIIRLRNKEIGFIRFLKYFLTSRPMLSAIMNLKVGVAQQNLSLTQIRDLTIPIPPITEQSRIVSELDLLQSIIDKQKAQLKELDNLAQAVFYDMFGDPVENEKGWEVNSLKSVAPQKQWDGSVPSVNGLFWLLNLDMVESQTGSIIEKVLVKQDEIGNSTIMFDTTNVLYSKLRPYLNKVVVPDEIGYGTSELVPLRPRPDVLNRIFFAYLLRNKSFVDYISGKVAGAKMPRVVMDDFRAFSVILPPIQLQQSFASKIESIEKQKTTISKSIEETQKLFDYTMDKYFG